MRGEGGIWEFTYSLPIVRTKKEGFQLCANRHKDGNTGVGGEFAKRVRGRGTGGRRLVARPRHLANVTINPVPQWTESMGR